MADSRPYIQPWKGNGLPIDIFKDNIREKAAQLICSRQDCDNVLRDPIQLECGDRVCKGCFESLRRLPPAQRICTACDLEGQNDHIVTTHEEMEVASTQPDEGVKKLALINLDRCHPDVAAAKEISKLNVTCPFKCGTDRYRTRPLTVKNLDKHMEECPQRLVACRTCTEAIVCSEEENHLRNACAFRLIDCPNECGKKGIAGKDLAKHLAECVKKPPTCRLCMKSFYGSHHSHLITECFATKCPFGCTDMKPGELTIHHLDDESKIARHVVALYDMLMSVKESQNKNQRGAVQSGITPSQMTAILDRLLQLECRSEKAERQLNEEMSQRTGKGAVQLLEYAGKAESNQKQIKDLRILFTVLAADIHKLSSIDKKCQQTAAMVKRQETAATERFDTLEASSQSRQSEIDKQKAALIDHELTSYGGRLIWRIDQVLSKRSEAHIRLSITSPVFYTAADGYRMCLRLFLNGDGIGKSSHISLYLVLLKGEFDALLTWPFQHSVTMKLRCPAKSRHDIVLQCKPDPRASYCVRPKTEMNPGFGIAEFADQEVVFGPDSGYIVDEAMFIEVIVNTSFESSNELPMAVQESRSVR